ncbi:MAG: isochorismatase family protein [Microvirga sp.]
MLLSAARSQLLVIDLQERLLPAIAGSDRVLRNVHRLLKAAALLGVPVTVTEQNPGGLGHTVALVLDILSPPTPILPKMTFAATGDAALRDRIAGLSQSGREQIVLCGTEAHVCVLQTALGLRAGGSTVFVVADAVSSRAPDSVAVARDRLLQAGCSWITAEMAMFEWLERAGTDAFRAMLPLIR